MMTNFEMASLAANVALAAIIGRMLPAILKIATDIATIKASLNHVQERIGQHSDDIEKIREQIVAERELRRRSRGG